MTTKTFPQFHVSEKDLRIGCKKTASCPKIEQSKLDYSAGKREFAHNGKTFDFYAFCSALVDDGHSYVDCCKTLE